MNERNWDDFLCCIWNGWEVEFIGKVSNCNAQKDNTPQRLKYGPSGDLTDTEDSAKNDDRKLTLNKFETNAEMGFRSTIILNNMC